MRQPFQQRYPELVVTCTVIQVDQVIAPALGAPGEDRWPWEEPVEVDLDGDVERGDIAVAWALCEATLARNPVLILGLLQRWMDAAEAADDAERNWRRGWERQLDANPAIAWALEQSPAAVLKRAGLNDSERDVFRRGWLEGESPRAIARDLGVSASTIRGWLEQGARRVQALRADLAVAN